MSPPLTVRPVLREQLEAAAAAVKKATGGALTIAQHGPAALERVLELMGGCVDAIEQLGIIVAHHGLRWRAPGEPLEALEVHELEPRELEDLKERRES